MAREPYRQTLPALGLSLERYTTTAPRDGRWHLLRSGAVVGSYRSWKAAREAWDAAVKESEWTPHKRELDPGQAIRREATQRWSRNRGG